jgi:hypothetical protein
MGHRAGGAHDGRGYPRTNVRRRSAIVLLAVFAGAMLGAPADAATAVPARYQLRGHLPELGEQPAMRFFLTQAAYDTFRTDLGDANVFPPSSSLFMSFDKDFLALYARGNDTGGRCIATTVAAGFAGDTLTATFDWQSGTCGGPATAHYPFILVAISRTASDGSSWMPAARSICGSVGGTATNACASFGAAAAPSPTPPPATTATPSATATPAATATRTLTPTATVPPASTSVATTPPSPSRSPVAAASPTPAPASGGGPDLVVAGALVGLGVLVGITLMALRRPKTPSGFGRR